MLVNAFFFLVKNFQLVRKVLPYSGNATATVNKHKVQQLVANKTTVKLKGPLLWPFSDLFLCFFFSIPDSS